MRNSRSLLSLLAFGLPAAFLLTTGIAKQIDPRGTAPEMLAPLLSVMPWSAWLRVVGGLEIVAALLLALPRTRSLGRYVAFALVAAFTVLLAVNASDQRFVSDCGCMGALGGRGPGPGETEALLLRNAVLLALLILSGGLADPSLSVRRALARAGTFSALLFLAAVAGAQHAKAVHEHEARAAESTARDHGSRLSWRIPDLAVTDLEGKEVGLRSAVQAGDDLLVLSTECGHCAEMGAEVHAMADADRAAGGRLVLLLIAPRGVSAREWLGAHGMDGVPAVSTPDPLDGFRLGVSLLPCRIRLGPDQRVVAHREHGGFASLVEELGDGSPLPASVRDEVWKAVAEAAAPGSRLASPATRQPDGGYEAPLHLADGADGLLLVRRDGSSRAYAVEVALGLDGSGRILRAVALATGSHAAFDLPELRDLLAALSGRTPGAARDWLLAQKEGVERTALARSLLFAMEGISPWKASPTK
jgi:hypothetical protein